MKIFVNGVTLNVTNAYPVRNTSEGTIDLFITVPYSEKDYAELKTLFKENTEDIIKTADDGSQETFSGFENPRIADDDANEIYTVTVTADEYAFQIGRNRQLEADKASLETTVSRKDMEISNLNGTISEKEKVIAENATTIEQKNVVISEKETTITEQAETITVLESTIATKDEELTAKDAEIAELLTIAEEYADMLYNEALEEMGAEEDSEEESEVI